MFIVLKIMIASALVPCLMKLAKMLRLILPKFWQKNGIENLFLFADLQFKLNS